MGFDPGPVGSNPTPGFQSRPSVGFDPDSRGREQTSVRALVAQWIAHKTSNLGVVGSNPTGGAFARWANGLVA